LRQTSQVRHLELQRKLTLTTTENGYILGRPKRRKLQYKGSLGARPNIDMGCIIGAGNIGCQLVSRGREKCPA